MPDEIKRVNYFTNQFLEEADFQAEQTYHQRMRQLHNQGLHTSGVAYGLGVTQTDDRQVAIAQGMALDPTGQEIVVLEGGMTHTLTTVELDTSIYLSVVASDVDVDPYKGVGFTDKFTRKAERLEVIESTALNPNAIVLAILTLDASGKIKSVNSSPVERKNATAVIAPNAITLDKLEPRVRPFTLDGVSNPGGNIDLVAANAITLNPNNSSKLITIGETHSARTDNPHSTTAAQVGALPITGGTLTGDLIFKAATSDPGDIIFNDSANRQKGRIWTNTSPGVSGLFLSSGDNNPDITIDQNGQVGIGVAPDAPLHVLGGNWDVNNTEGDFRLGDSTFKFKIGIARGGGGSGDVRMRAQGGSNRLILGGGTSDFLSIQDNTGTILTGQLNFGTTVRQMINLWSTAYGIGIQNSTAYFRSDDNFCWFRGGTHNDARDNPGGGVRLMALNGAGDLILSSRTNPAGNPAGSPCRALVDGGNKLVINFANDFTSGVDITNGRFVSSRALKDNITELSEQEAMTALTDLNPVKFHFKNDVNQDQHVGFIAEDVPELVAAADRKSIGPLDLVAVLTKVVQQQQRLIGDLTERITILEQQGQSG